MAFSDPQSVTVSGTAVSLPRTGSGADTGTFKSSDGLYQMVVQHAYGKRGRHTIKLIGSKVVSDPLIPSQSKPVSMTVSLTTDLPLNGYSVAEAKAVVDAFTAYLTASTGARVTQLLGGEN